MKFKAKNNLLSLADDGEQEIRKRFPAFLFDRGAYSPLTITDSNYNANNNYDADAAYIDATYGGYYSWHTATAGTGTASVNTEGTDAPGSICPKGWRLPTSNDFAKLERAYGLSSSALQATPAPGFKLGGRFLNNGGGYFGGKGSYGYYWSSTAYDANRTYYLGFGSSGVNPAYDYGDKYYGRSVRCVSRQ